MKRHQRSSVEPASLLSLFSKTPTHSTNHDHHLDSPLANRTNRRSADITNTLIDTSLKSRSRSNSPQTRSSSISPSPMLHPQHHHQRTINQERWSVWTADSTLHPDLDDRHNQDEVDDPHKTYCTDSQVEMNHKRFDVVGRGIGVNMGIELPHNRCSIASTSSRSTASSIQSSAVSPYTPCSVDSQPVMGLCSEPTGVPPTSNAGRSCPSPYCQAGDEEEEEDDDDEEVNAALDAALSSTMLALEAANSLLVSTMSSRTHLARLRATEHALDAMMTERERELLRQIEHNRQMGDHMDRVCTELSDMARSFPSSASLSLSKRVWTPLSTGSSTAETRVSIDPKLGGIVEALDENATVGKTAAKRLERMLKGDADSSSSSRMMSTSPPSTSIKDARSLLSAFATPTPATADARSVSDSVSTSSTTSKKTTPSRRSSHSQLSPSTTARPSMLAGKAHRSSPSAPVLHHASSSSAMAATSVNAVQQSSIRPPFTRAKSSLSQAFGMPSAATIQENETKCHVDGLPSSSGETLLRPPITPEQRLLELPDTDDSSRSDAESDLLQDFRRFSAGHARSPSVIKPSTASSALLSPDLSEWNQWRIQEEADQQPDTPQSILRGHGALAALRSLNSQTHPPTNTSRPPSVTIPSSPRVPTTTSIAPAASRTTDTPASNNTTTDTNTPPTPADATSSSTTTKSWTLSGWMRFNNSSQSQSTDTITPSLVNSTSSSSIGSIIEHGNPPE